MTMEQKGNNLLKSKDMLKKCAVLEKENEELKLQNAKMKSQLKKTFKVVKMVIDCTEGIPTDINSSEAVCN